MQVKIKLLIITLILSAASLMSLQMVYAAPGLGGDQASRESGFGALLSQWKSMKSGFGKLLTIRLPSFQPAIKSDTPPPSQVDWDEVLKTWEEAESKWQEFEEADFPSIEGMEAPNLEGANDSKMSVEDYRQLCRDMTGLSEDMAGMYESQEGTLQDMFDQISGEAENQDLGEYQEAYDNIQAKAPAMLSLAERFYGAYQNSKGEIDCEAPISELPEMAERAKEQSGLSGEDVDNAWQALEDFSNSEMPEDIKEGSQQHSSMNFFSKSGMPKPSEWMDKFGQFFNR